MSLLNRTIIIITLIFISGKLNAQSFQWATDIKSEGYDEGYDLVTDDNGYVYVAGQIEFVTNFGFNTLIESAGVHDIFLAKYTPSGTLVWAKRAGGKGGDKIQSITLDKMGHIFVAGEYDDTCHWEGIMHHTTGRGVNDFFIAKYDTSGSVIWVKSIGGISGPLQTRGYGVTCDAQGNVYACGGVNGSAYYENTFLFTTAGDYDGTIYKFDPNGNLIWARNLGGASSDKAYGIVSDNLGHIYVTGYTAGNAQFSPSVTVQGRGHTDVFLAKYDTAGALQWVTLAGDTGFDRGWDVTINVNGNIVITGTCQTGYFGTNQVHTRGNGDMFLAAYDHDGNNLWAITGGGVEDDLGRGVSHDSSGNIYVIGDYASSATFPPSTITSNGYADVFLASYTSDGSALNWIQSAGGLLNDRGRGVGTDPSGNVYICGEYNDNIQFGATTLIGDTNLDIFVSQLKQGIFCATQVSVSTQQNVCNGLCDGTASATVTGQGPFTFSWSTTPPQNGAVASGLCAGNYIVTATEANGCSSTASATLTYPPQLQSSTNSTDANCAGSCDGTATISAIGGQGPYTFNWLTSPPQSGTNATGLCQGTFTVIATDASGCSITSVAVVDDPTALNVTASITNASCIGCADGDIDIHVSGGTTNYNFQWSNGSTHQDLHNIVAGNYEVCITDANNCNLCDTFNVIEPGTGITTLNSSGQYSVFPNPFNTSTTIKVKNAFAEKTMIALYSTTGQVVYQTEFRGDEFILQRDNLSNGVYFLKINNLSTDASQMIRLIVEE